MKINDCLKQYQYGMQKAIAPQQAYKYIKDRLKSMEVPIVDELETFMHPSGIPQCRIVGSSYYKSITRHLFPFAGEANGKGHTDEQALLSGLMELVERYSCAKYIVNDMNVSRRCSFNEMRNNPFHVDEIYKCIPCGKFRRMLEREKIEITRLNWYEAYMLDGEKAQLPMRLIIDLIEGPNGMAAGNTFEEALLKAICESVERHCTTRIEIEKLKTPVIDIKTIDSDIARKLIANYDRVGSPVLIRECSLGFDIPVIAVVRKINSQECLVTTGVATTREEALIRALTESSQDEEKMNYFEIESSKHYFVVDQCVPFNSVSDIVDKNIKNEIDKINSVLNKSNMRIFYIDATDNELGIPAVMVFVSGAMMPWFHLDVSFSPECIKSALIQESYTTGDYGECKRRLGIIREHKKECAYLKIVSIFFNALVALHETGLEELVSGLLEIMKTLKNAIPADKANYYHSMSLKLLTLCYQALGSEENVIQCLMKIYNEYEYEYLEFGYLGYYETSRSSSLLNRKLIRSVESLYNDIIELAQYCRPLTCSEVRQYRNQKTAAIKNIEEGKKCIKIGKYDKAIKQFRASLQQCLIVGKRQKAHLLLGYALKNVGLYDQAVIELKKAEETNPEAGKINQHISECYYRLGRVREANAEHSKAVRKSNRKLIERRESLMIQGLHYAERGR